MSELPKIIDREPLIGLRVPFGTLFSQLELPEFVVVRTDQDEALLLPIQWKNESPIYVFPEYDPQIARRYTLTGVLTVPNDLDTNGFIRDRRDPETDEFIEWVTQFTVIIQRQAQTIESTLDQYQRVELGQAPDLPSTITIVLNDGSSVDLPVTWDNGTPPFSPTRPGISRFRGTIDVPEDIDARGIFSHREG